jgi:cobalt-zinc-cadmium efflux system outer membrane protein
MKRVYVVVLAVLLGHGHAAGQERADTTLSFRSYLQQVTAHNLELLAAQHRVPIAQAQVAQARVFPDPVVSGGISQVDVSGQAAPLMSTLGVTIPVELGGKRGARITAAARDVSVAEAALDDSLRKLRADAATTFVQALAARLVLERKKQTLSSLERLVEVNTRRVQSGDIGEVALIQSRVESQRYRGEVLAAEGELRAAEQALRLPLGSAALDRKSAVTVKGELLSTPRTFDRESLMQQATARADVRAQRLSVEAAQARTSLAARNRMVDVSLNVSWQRSLLSEPFASPQYDALSAVLSLPLPFSRIYRGELQAAQHTEAQSRLLQQEAQLRAEVEVEQALTRYQASVRQLALYKEGLMADAERVLAATLYSYQRGSATLLEVLNAQRTVDDVHLSYTAALTDHALQLIAVEQAAGIWDLDF